MKQRFYIFFFFAWLSINAFAQKFDSKDFPAENYTVKIDTYHFKKVNIEHIRIRPKSAMYLLANCRTFLKVMKKDSVIKEYYFPMFTPSNGCYGIYVPDKQPLKNWFVMQQMDDGSDQLYLIDTLGSIFTLKGSSFCYLPGTNYIFGYTSNPNPTTTVFNLSSKTNLNAVAAGDDFFEWYFDGKVFYSNYSYEQGDKTIEKMEILNNFDSRVIIYPGARTLSKTHTLLPEFPDKNLGNCLCK